VDGPGIRMVLAPYEMANQHRLSCVAGTQHNEDALAAPHRIDGRSDRGALVAGHNEVDG